MKLQITKKRVAKIFLYGILSVLGLLVSSYFILQIPSVQKSLLSRYLAKLNRVTNFEISTDRIFLYWYDRLEVDGLRVFDPERNEMIYIDQLLVNFQIFQLQENHEVNIDGVSLDSARVNLVYIPDSDSTKDININEFIAAINKMFAPPPGSTPRSPKVNIGEIVLANSFSPSIIRIKILLPMDLITTTLNLG